MGFEFHQHKRSVHHLHTLEVHQSMGGMILDLDWTHPCTWETHHQNIQACCHQHRETFLLGKNHLRMCSWVLFRHHMGFDLALLFPFHQHICKLVWNHQHTLDPRCSEIQKVFGRGQQRDK